LSSAFTCSSLAVGVDVTCSSLAVGLGDHVLRPFCWTHGSRATVSVGLGVHVLILLLDSGITCSTLGVGLGVHVLQSFCWTRLSRASVLLVNSALACIGLAVNSFCLPFGGHFHFSYFVFEILLFWGLLNFLISFVIDDVGSAACSLSVCHVSVPRFHSRTESNLERIVIRHFTKFCPLRV
jgi:hypothetical protein